MITWYASLDGSLGKIVPVGERVYKRLQLLQTLMQTHVSHIGGLNPKEYRSVSKIFFLGSLSFSEAEILKTFNLIILILLK